MSGEVVRPWRQSFPFSCGPAALGSLMEHLGWTPPGPRWTAELQLWRESTAVACPGAHPLGLALAARRRGFAAQVILSGPRPWLWAHIHGSHGFASRVKYTRVEQMLARECAAYGVRVEGSASWAPPAGPGLLLTTARTPEPDPHWVGLLPRPAGRLVLDPLRRVAHRPPRPFSAWWLASGFGGTRSWVGLRPPPQSGFTTGLRAPRAGGTART